MFRAIAIGAAAIGIMAIISADVWALPQSIVAFGFGLLGAYSVTHMLYAGLRPKGQVYGMSFGQQCVYLTEVHPNFIAAVEAMRAQAVADRGVKPLWQVLGRFDLSTSSLGGNVRRDAARAVSSSWSAWQPTSFGR